MKNQILFLFIFISTAALAQPACQWAYLPVSPTQSYNTIYNATTDHSGKVILVGKLLGTADMNPGSGAADTSFTNGGYNYYISYPFFTTILDANPYIQLDDSLSIPTFLSVPGDGNNGYTAAPYFGTIEPSASVPLNTIFTGILIIMDPNDATFSCSQTFSFTYGDFFTGANEPDSDLLQIFPNPTNGRFRILLPTDHAEITITNAIGQEVLKTQSVGKITDLQLDKTGVFWVCVKKKQGSTMRKLVVNR